MVENCAFLMKTGNFSIWNHILEVLKYRVVIENKHQLIPQSSLKLALTFALVKYDDPVNSKLFHAGASLLFL